MKRNLKNIMYFIIALTFFFSFNFYAKAVAALPNDGTTYISENSKTVIDEKCDSIFGDPEISSYPAYWMQWIINAMKYIAIIALLVLSTMDFIKALVSNDKDALKKAGTTTAKRFIYCVMIFFLPIIIEFLMSLVGAYGTCGVS